MKISVVIPAFNEETALGATLELLNNLGEEVEIIVVDGGSADATVAVAKTHGARVVVSERGRGTQLANGAEAATGDVLWFLHADTHPENGAFDAIRTALEDEFVVGGNFTLVFDGYSRPARFMTWIYPHFRKLGLLYGDSAIFVRREVYEECGGFKSLPLFEDLEFVKRLKKQGRLAYLKTCVTTSSRRFEKKSFTLTFLKWVVFQGLYWFGVSPHFLARHYYPVRKKAADRE